MLKRATERQQKLPKPIAQKLSFHEGDVRTYNCNQKFDVVISLFHVMSYMTSDTDLQQAFETAKKHLNPNGIFIFDCWYGPGVIADKPTSRKREFENKLTSVVRTSSPVLHEEKHIVDVNFDISIVTKKTNETVLLKELHSMRYLFTEELINIGNTIQLKLACHEEWLTKNELNSKSWNACYVFKNNVL